MHHDTPPAVRDTVAAAAAHTSLLGQVAVLLILFAKCFPIGLMFPRTHLRHACLVTACAIGCKVPV